LKVKEALPHMNSEAFLFNSTFYSDYKTG